MFNVSSEYSFKIFVLGLTHLLSIFNVFRYSVVCCILLKSMSMDWFLLDRDLRHERVNENRDEVGQLKELWSEYLFFF